MKRANLILCVLSLLSAVGCSKEPLVTQTRGPLLALVVASSIDSQGRPVNPRFTFAADEPRITVIVRVGKLTSSSSLRVTWYRTSDEGNEKLFEHEIKVSSFERAFSEGINPGTFAVGNYKVIATLQGETQEIEFDIAEKQAKFSEDKQPPRVLLVAERSGATRAAPAPAQGQPPVSGRSGSAPASPATKGNSYVRLLAFVVDGDMFETLPELQSFIADKINLQALLYCDVASTASTTVSVTVNGSPVNLPLYYYEQTVDGVSMFETHSRFDPCSLGSGASDLPGAKFDFTATTHGECSGLTRSATIILDKDDLAPAIHVTSTPAKGTRVKAGQQIEVKVNATEQRQGGPWQTGIQTIKINAQYALLGTWTNPSPQPMACGQKTWEQTYTKTYIVPSNPPTTIHICAMAQDYAHNTDVKCATFPTDTPEPALWTGTVSGEKTVTYIEPKRTVVIHYTTSDRLRLREVETLPITVPDRGSPGYRIVGYKISLKNDGSSAKATYQSSNCSDQSSTTSSEEWPTAYIWYKTVSEAVTESGLDIPRDGIYGVVFTTWGPWTACPGGNVVQYGLGYGLGVDPISISKINSYKTESELELKRHNIDPETRHLTDGRTHMIGQYTWDVPLLHQGGSVHTHVSWDICRAGSRGCITENP